MKVLYFRRHDDNKGMLSACRFAKLTQNGNMRQIIYQKPVDGSVTAKEWKDAFWRQYRWLFRRMDQMTCAAAAFGVWLEYPALLAADAIHSHLEWKRNHKVYERIAKLWTANAGKKGLAACSWKGSITVETVEQYLTRYADSQRNILSWTRVSSQGSQWIVMLVEGSVESFGKSKVYFCIRQLPDNSLEVTAIGVKRMLAPYENIVGSQLDQASISVIEDVLYGLQKIYKGKLEPEEMLKVTAEQRKAYKEACKLQLDKFQDDLISGIVVSGTLALLSFFVLAPLFIGILVLIILFAGGLIKLP